MCAKNVDLFSVDLIHLHTISAFVLAGYRAENPMRVIDPVLNKLKLSESSVGPLSRASVCWMMREHFGITLLEHKSHMTMHIDLIACIFGECSEQ
jgi:hypothetical protein